MNFCNIIGRKETRSTYCDSILFLVRILANTGVCIDARPRAIRLLAVSDAERAFTWFLLQNKHTGHHCLREIFPSDMESGICENFLKVG